MRILNSNRKRYKVLFFSQSLMNSISSSWIFNVFVRERKCRTTSIINRTIGSSFLRYVWAISIYARMIYSIQYIFTDNNHLVYWTYKRFQKMMKRVDLMEVSSENRIISLQKIKSWKINKLSIIYEWFSSNFKKKHLDEITNWRLWWKKYIYNRKLDTKVEFVSSFCFRERKNLFGTLFS